MDWIPALRLDRSHLVYRFSDDVDDSAEGSGANRHGNRTLKILCRHTAHHAVGRLEGDAADAAFSKVLLHFYNHIDGRRHIEAGAGNVECRVDGRLLSFRKFDVYGGPDNLRNFSDICHL